ncbi:MAG: phosphate acetyltransferase [Chlorobi bacterium]|nr:phosphate acetyltransferase [Chlorobiota bacterium]MCI0714973.1 phosphate acetyltransferase [Chlorobiota bacterium]
MDLFKKLEKKVKKRSKTIILPESYDERVIKAARIILKKKLAKVILISTGKPVKISNDKNLDMIDINFSKQFMNEYISIKRKKNPQFSSRQAENDLSDPLTFACMLLRNNFADAVVAGSVYETSSVIRNGISIIGLSKNNKTVSSFFLFTFPKRHRLQNRIFAYADCGVLPNPTASQLSDIAVQTSANFKKLTGITPKAAFLSFSTKGSAKDESLHKVIEAYKLTKKRAPNLKCDGELQFDAAFVPHVAERKNPGGTVKGDANVFIFPDLNSGNIAYKITERIGGAAAAGPLVQGLAKPVMDLSRGCSANDIVNMATIASLI